ncbi:Crp/Fnr family transcriptional regulator [Maridesulfovibrio sp.]|uniref:Crp/Fnr family transcriptional regulator n=1 Tax=Maridesulfovibrio sp. TaxID=2795000 RepID=UPI0029F594ED|nr:Crp/Fnr family transcriptional regulator [Maridesulfovibrio sp.]
MLFATEASKHVESLRKIGVEVTIPKEGCFDYANVYYLEEGVAALTHLTESGEQSSFIYFKSGMLLNFLRAVTLKTGVASSITLRRFDNLNHTIYAKTKCKCISINGEKFLDYIEKNPELYKLLLQSLSDNLINLLSISTDIVTKPANIRVCQILLDFMTDDDPPQIPRYLTYNEIAFYLSMHVITVTKVFKALKESGIIAKKGWMTTVIDRERLRAIVEGEEELGYLR